MAEGGEKKFTSSAGVITEEEERLLHALHLLGIKPKLGSVEDVSKLLHVFGNTKEETEESTIDTSHKHGTFQFPKLPVFYGEEGKGEVNWTSFRYEVEALQCEGIFKDEQILLGIRRSCKGKAADCVRRLGPGVTVKDVMEKFESDYGSVESRESIMRKFYGCSQNPDESVSSFASRLEDIFDQAVTLKAIKKSDTLILKEVLHSGLNKDLKHLSLYHCDKIINYDEFKKELRKLEASLLDNDKRHTCKAASQVDNQSKDISEMKELLKTLHERIDKLEKNTEHNQQRGAYRSRSRGYRGRGYNTRGRGTHRPLANQNFQPTCYNCNQKGHIERNCPSLSDRFTCYNCNQKGHKKYNCPNM